VYSGVRFDRRDRGAIREVESPGRAVVHATRALFGGNETPQRTDVSQRDARLMANRMSAAGATLTRMAFKMNRSGPEPALEFDDRDKFEALSGGVLKISRPDKRNLYITP
jgi:hypothetical protein